MPPSSPILPRPLAPRVSRAVAAGVIAAFGISGPLRGANPELEAGGALIQSFGLRDYHAHSEVWAAAQDARGVLYFGNKDVVLEYDGVVWRKLPVPGTTFVRGVAFDPASGEVFVGAVDQLGYLRLDPDGGRTFVSLLDRLPAGARDFRDIRRVHATASGEIFFAAESQVMRWRTGRFTVWRPGNQEKLNSFLVDGRFYLHSRDLGLLRLDGEQFVPVPAGADFPRADAVTVLLPGGRAGELLAGTSQHGLWRLSADGRALPFPTGVDGFLQLHKLRRGCVLPDGSLALATGDAGLVSLGGDGRFLNRVDQAAGLPRDQVLDLFTDREGGLWVGLSFGVARVELSGAISVFGPPNGLPRTITNDLVRVDGALFLATDNGLFRLAPAVPGPDARPARWEQAAGGELWSICPDGAGGVLAGTIDSVYQWHPDGRTEPVLASGIQPRVLYPSPRDPARVWLAVRDGLRSLRRENDGHWRDEGPLPDLNEEVRTLVEKPDGTVWIGTPNRGVFRLTFAAAGDGSRGAASVRRYFKSDGLPENMQWTRGLPWHGGSDVLFATGAGLYRHDAGTDRFLPVPDYGARLADGTFTISGLVEDAAHDLWLWGRPAGGAWQELEFGRAGRGGVPFDPLPGRIADQLGDIQGVLPEIGADGTSVLWVYGTDGMARVVVPPRGQRAARQESAAFRTHLRRVSNTNAPDAGLPLGGPHTLPASRNSVRFEFAADTYRYGADVRFQTRLDGGPPSGAAWSEFSPRTGVDYTNLPAGNYIFRARGRDRDGRLGGEAMFAFTVRPPWTRTGWAYAGYVLSGALVVGGLVQWRSRRLRGANTALAERISRQTGALVRARDDAEAANRAKSAFLANMSHELRTPLNAVLGYTQILLKEPALGEKNRERLDAIARSGAHLLSMINEVLDLSKIEAGKLPLEPADFRLGHLLDAVADTFRLRAAEKRIAFRFELTPDLPAAVHGDEGKLRQVLFNLLGNAVKFTSRGEVALKVTRAANVDRIRFEVIDTGIGIPPADLDHIFLAFHQAAGAALSAQGTGLGLAISQRLVAMLGGELRVASTLGAGSRFWFDLPLPARANEAAGSPVPVLQPGTVVTGYHGARRRLLVVDDDATNRRILQELLAPLGFEVEALASGEECVARCARVPLPDAVLLDLRMGGMDGFETARLLRARGDNPGLKVIAVSASVFESDRQQAIAAGCDDFVPKPFAETALLAVIGRALTLEWITTSAPVESAPAMGRPGEGTPVPLPRAEVDTLMDLSRRGDVLKIRRRLASLRAADGRYAPAVKPLEDLAASYQMNRLRDALLELQHHEP